MVPDSGTVYIYHTDDEGLSWETYGTLSATDGASGDYFGVSVSVDANIAVIGAQFDDDKGTDSGVKSNIIRYQYEL